MAMKTPEEYIESLRDGRELYMNGRRIDDVTQAPEFDTPIAYAAKDYDYTDQPDLRTYTDENGERANRLYQIPRTKEDLDTRIELMRNISIVSATVGGLFALLNVKDKLAAAKPEYGENIEALYTRCRENDLRIAQVVTDPKGDRSRHPLKQDDPDLYLRVVERNADGIVVRGAKLHITGAALVHELIVLPTKSMGEGEEDYAVAFSIPVATKGLKIINRNHAEPGRSVFDYPVSARHSMPEGFVVFDEVFVPWDRVFLCGEHRVAGTLARALGLWERVGGLIAMVDTARLFVGIAQLLAEYNGIQRASHVIDKITEIIFHAELLEMALESSIRNYKTTESGMVYPNPRGINVGKYHGATNYHGIVRHLHDLCGGQIVTQPVEADFRNPELAPYFEKYFHTHEGVTVENRMKLYNLLRDITADTYGGWAFVTNVQAGGGLAAQKIITYRTYDLDAVTQLAKDMAGIVE
ncbi:MAG: 4-hydroxyphenylacetate 3-hydroxylase [Candidatus Hydrogenedentes bacterium]|nr:4-hydroxyphenylacetate 3-hydroxylase [Candidatus Hydrogenedentota bacterium]